MEEMTSEEFDAAFAAGTPVELVVGSVNARYCCGQGYICPSSGMVECPEHGGFDRCCDHPACPSNPPTQAELIEGHLFEISMRSWSVFTYMGSEEDVPHRTQADWTLPPHPVFVRAWDLPAALRKAAELPLDAWFDREDEDS